MKSIIFQLKRVTWYQWFLATAAVIYIIYIALSTLYLPGKLKSVTETDVSKLIGREISVEEIQYNPFSLSLTIKNLAVSDEPEKPLLAWEQLLVNFGFWKSVFSWGIVLNEIRLDKPQVNIFKDRGGFNFSDIIGRLSASDHKNSSTQEKTGSGKSIALEIFNTSINLGSFRYTDNSGTVPAGSHVDDLSIVIKELYFATGDEHLNTFNINAKGPLGGQLNLTGSYRIDPLHVEGSIDASGIVLSTFSGFLENILPIKLSKGTLSLSTDILAEKDAEFLLKTSNGELSINGLVLDDNVSDPAMLSAGDISVNGFRMDFNKKSMTVEKVMLDTITANQWIDKDGRPRYKRLLMGKKDAAPETEEGAPENNNKPGAPWDILIKEAALKNSTINFEDQNEEISSAHSLSAINLKINDISLTPDSKIFVELSALLDETGDIRVDGAMSPSPFSMALNYQLDKILLQPFSEYLEASSWLSIEEGSLSVEGSASIGKGEADTIRATAALGVDDFKLKDTRTGHPFFRFKAFKVDDVKAEIDKQSVSVSSVTLSKPEVHLSVSKQKKMNLAELMKSTEKEPAASTSGKKKSDSTKWTFKIEKTNLRDGTVLFSDNSIMPAFKTTLNNMTFSIDQISSNMKEAAPFSFQTDIDEYAPFTITGSLEPFDKQLAFSFKSMLKGLEMPRLSQYSGVYIGNNLKSGKLSLNLDYSLHDRKLKGNNNITAKNLYLGDTVPVKPVINAPVGLGLALLRDLNGVIDLNVGISGDLDDPGFSVTGVVIKTLVNILVKAAASPFKLLGALIPGGGGGDDLGEVAFDPGADLINMESKDRLKKLFTALNLRPQLTLIIKGNASGQEDIDALKLTRVKQLIAEKRGIDIPGIESVLQGQEIWMLIENRQALVSLNNEMNLLSVAQRTAKLKAEISDNPAKQDGSEAHESEVEQALFAQIFNDILNAQNINEETLISLADQRALSIKQYLVVDLKLSQERISVIKTRSSDLSGRVIKLGIDVK